MTFYTGGSERVRIDTAGFVGIGTSTSGEKLSVVSADNVLATNIFAVRANNLTQGVAITFSGIKKLTTGTDNDLYIDGASSGSIILNRIVGSGNVGINKTSPASKLYISTASTTAYGLISQTPVVGLTAGNYVNMAYFADARGDNNDGLRILNVRDSTGSSSGDWSTSSYRIRRSVDQNDGSSGIQEEIGFGSNVIWFNTNGTERVRIDSSGNVGIGTTSPSYKLHVVDNSNGFHLTAGITGTGDSGAVLGLQGNGSNPNKYLRAYNGNFQILNSAISTAILDLTDGGALSVTSYIQGNGETFANSNSVLGASFGSSIAGASLRSSDDASGVTFQAFRKANNTVIGSISRVTTTDAVAYNTTSDGRLKENLRDFTDSGRLIDSLKPRVFDWKNSDENGKNVVGFIAQEEHAADPIFAHIGAVSVGDEDPETITKQWQRSDSALIPILVAELKALRQRVAALEAR
jgi:hypothetical protein